MSKDREFDIDTLDYLGCEEEVRTKLQEAVDGNFTIFNIDQNTDGSIASEKLFKAIKDVEFKPGTELNIFSLGNIMEDDETLESIITSIKDAKINWEKKVIKILIIFGWPKGDHDSLKHSQLDQIKDLLKNLDYIPDITLDLGHTKIEDFEQNNITDLATCMFGHRINSKIKLILPEYDTLNIEGIELPKHIIFDKANKFLETQTEDQNSAASDNNVDLQGDIHSIHHQIE